ncbi:hypothetical protein LTR53_006551 [Teratosphaeriaceae sp. CCFEE 6253]|nr:hypothetical protein LTR53_006551 [Teratosphaeriaceae sp. CCFEE 6253]
MSAIARRTALQGARTFNAARTPFCVARRTYADNSASSNQPQQTFSGDNQAEQANKLKEGARKDPELYILLAIMTGAFSLAGWHFSRNPTSSSSENRVAQAVDSEPWKTGKDAKYQYHPHGDTSRPKKDAPSALNEVIIPNVNLPKSLHEKYNKWGKEGY